MKWFRAARAELYKETEDMSIDERRERESRRPTDPELARWFDRMKEGTRTQSEGRRGDESGSSATAHRRRGTRAMATRVKLLCPEWHCGAERRSPQVKERNGVPAIQSRHTGGGAEHRTVAGNIVIISWSG